MSQLPLQSDVPELRIRPGNAANVRTDGKFVVYWMIANRRSSWNFSLQRAIDWSLALKKPLVVFEALRCGYQWASDRLHQFVIQGMADNAQALGATAATYYPYLELRPGDGSGLLAALSVRACVVVTDDYPCFFLPRMTAAAAKCIPVRFEVVDSNGLLPMRAAHKNFVRAFDFRCFLQRNLSEHLLAAPSEDPFCGVSLPTLNELPQEILSRWPRFDTANLSQLPALLSTLPLDHCVAVVDEIGGQRAARQQLNAFLDHRLGQYDNSRNHPDQEATSGLSPYLHFGHLSAHEVFFSIANRENWSPNNLATKATGKRAGWWGLSAAAEAFLDQLSTWRELGFNMCSQRDDYNRYTSLPEWSQKTLAKHSADQREAVYTLAEFESAATHDPLWNAAQRQLVREGQIHNYLRMLWGKKILQWSPSPQEALATMIELNNKYALDGRDPNSYSGIFWILGRYDRAWGPERPVFGTVRYMTSESAMRKLHLKEYLKKYADFEERGSRQARTLF
jgi:deoxyribodipyrimidine photo-lyase